MMNVIKYRWDKYGHKVRERFAKTKRSDINGYLDILKIAIEEVFNAEYSYPSERLDVDHIHEIDDGDYQGTLVYLIPFDSYQPCEHEYLMTYVDYGSCSGCDTFQWILDCCGGSYTDEFFTDEAVKELTVVAKDMLTNMIKPYNYGWRNTTYLYDPVEKENYDGKSV